MDFELTPLTAPGERLVALAAQHAADFAPSAAQHDRDGSFPFEHIEAMRQSGVLAACVPHEFGGLGVESLHDYVLGINRLGRGDGSTAIAANMHIFQPWRLTRLWRTATAAGQERRAAQLAQLLRQIGAGQVVMCPLLSEPGTDLLHPLVEATKTADGWRLNGRKNFGTMSSVAQLFNVSCRVRDGQGQLHWAFATVPRESPGVDVRNNWDALGMRASGSHDVVLTDCLVLDDALITIGPWGEWTEVFLGGNLSGTMGLVGAFLGIAEAARTAIVALVTTQRKGPSGRMLAERYPVQHTIAEIEIDLAASRAMLGRTATLADALFQQYPHGGVPLDALHQQMKDFQCTKWFVTRKAIEIVDRALTASGGVGYLSQSPLSRLYRDVRAGPFMQLFSPNEAFGYIGKVTLGLDPRLEG
jgi:alkylation response protein AidB-like acyl-CoA dehydrogenase